MSADVPAQPNEQIAAAASSGPATARRLNWPLALAVGAMVAFVGLRVASYFMQWDHGYAPNTQPWPMADLADSQPFIPFDIMFTQNPSGIATGYVVFLLGPPALYGALSLLGLVASRRWRVALGVINALIAIPFVLLSLLIIAGPNVSDSTWLIWIDAGAWVALAASVGMVLAPLAFLRVQGKLFIASGGAPSSGEEPAVV